MRENPYQCQDYEEPEPPTADEIAEAAANFVTVSRDDLSELAGQRDELLIENEALKRERNAQLVNLRAVVANRCQENPYDWETDWWRHQMWLIVHDKNEVRI